MNDKQLDRIESKLDLILSWIYKIESSDYTAQQDSKDFIINVAADLFVENLNKNKNETNKTTR